MPDRELTRAATTRPGAVPPAAVPRHGTANRVGHMLNLQTRAGNRAVVRMLRPTVQRCGPKPCDCPDEERAAYDATRGTVQRVSDWAVSGKPENAKDQKDTILFDLNSAVIDGDEPGKIPGLAAPTDREIVLKGSASEEGGGNVALTDKRIANVDQALHDAGHDDTKRTKEAKPTAGAGDINYRQARSVEVRVKGTASAHPDCSLGPQENDCGTAPNPFSTALKRAHDMVAGAVSKLSAPDAATDDLLKKLFGDPSVAKQLVDNFKLVDGQLTAMEPFGGGHGHRCVNICDSDCGGGATAYNSGTGAGALMTLCPVYMVDPDLDSRASVLIHEGSHGTDTLETQDLSYQWQRLITQLPQASALKNADSYTALALLLDKPGSITLGPKHPDTHDTAMTTDQIQAADQAVAWIEQWLMGMDNEMSSLYGIINESRATKTPTKAAHWTNTYYEGTMTRIAPLFGLMSPPPVPRQSDQVAVAGITDRYASMLERVGAQLAISTSPGTATSFGPGDTLHLGAVFLAQTPRKRVETLLAAVIATQPNIRPALRDAYRRAVLRILLRGNIGTP